MDRGCRIQDVLKNQNIQIGPRTSIDASMPRKKESCECGQVVMGYTVESVVSIDGRGQMVIPKDIRSKFGVEPNDRLAIATSSRNGKVCCIHLFMAKELDDRVKEVVRPTQGTARE